MGSRALICLFEGRPWVVFETGGGGSWSPYEISILVHPATHRNFVWSSDKQGCLNGDPQPRVRKGRVTCHRGYMPRGGRGGYMRSLEELLATPHDSEVVSRDGVLTQLQDTPLVILGKLQMGEDPLVTPVRFSAQGP